MPERRGLKIAVAGKGGVGKTTLSAGIVEFLDRQGSSVYAVDADPDVSLGEALGLDAETLDSLRPLADLAELIEERTGRGGLFVLNPRVDDVLDTYSLPLGRTSRLLRMGGVKAGGTECYCRENAFLRSVVESVVLERDEVVVLDMGAGIEHLSRGTARGVNLLVVVAEPTPPALKSARVIAALATRLGLPVVYVGNKVRTGDEEDLLRRALGDDLVAVLPFSPEVWAGEGIPSAFRDRLATAAERVLARAGSKDLCQ